MSSATNVHIILEKRTKHSSHFQTSHKDVQYNNRNRHSDPKAINQVILTSSHVHQTKQHIAERSTPAEVYLNCKFLYEQLNLGNQAHEEPTN